jgi:TP901 family phage tail tape measure protein
LADVNAEIGVNIDTSSALAQLKALQREIARFHTSVAKSSDAAALAQRDLQKNFLNGVNAIRGFSAELRTVKTTAENFTDSLERNKFSMREYFRYSMASTKSFGRMFSSELDTVNKVATENVKRLQTQYIKMGRDANGAMRAIAVMPTKLDLSNVATQTQLAAQKQAIFNQLVKQGSTNLLNFGKNTQWAGRQLMVGFTIPLMGLGSVAARTFMDMETAAIKFKKVYGDLFTPTEETQFALESIQMLGKEFTKYGIAVADTVSLASEAAAAGFAGADLQAQVTQATRLQVLGQIDQQKALETTISLQNAFRISSQDLGDSINFLNAVENQTVVSLDDITTAIPKAAPIVRELGGDVKDLAFFMAAMKEGGINASEGANALKSGLASLINPTNKAKGMLMDMGINIDKIVESNVGNLKATVIEFAKALDGLSNLQRQRAIEQLFGKFQQARLSALFDNVIKDGNQASRVLDLASASMEDLASLAEKELGITANSAMNQFRASVEKLKLALAPVGQVFIQILTPLLEKLNKLLEWFNSLPESTRKAIAKAVLYLGGLAPVILMTIGLMANFVANGIKGLMLLRNGFLRLTGQSKVLGEQTQYLTIEQQNALAAAVSLEQSHIKLQQAFTGEATSVRQLIAEYQRMIGVQNTAATRFPGMMQPGFRAKGYANGVVSVPGPKGAGDVVPAMLSPGESVIPAKQSKKYGALIQGIVADNIPGYKNSNVETQIGSRVMGQIPIYGEYAMRLQDPTENMKQRAGATSVPNVLAPLTARLSEARGVAPTLANVEAGKLDQIAKEYTGIVENFVNKINEDFNDTSNMIKDSNERFASSWKKAGKAMEDEVNKIASDVDRGVVRKTFGLDPDVYSTIPTEPRKAGGTVPERARGGAFRKEKFGISSYTGMRPSIKALYRRITGKSGSSLQMGHVFGPQMANISDLQQDTMKSSNVAKAAQVMNMQAAAVTNQAIQTAEKTAQTQSPSKRTIKIGEDIARGLQVGMANQMDETKAASQKLSSAATSLINPKTGKPFTQQELTDLTRVPASQVANMASSAGRSSVFLGMPSMPDGPEERQQRFGKVRGAVGKGIARVKGAGGGFGLSALMFSLSMLPGKFGQLAQSIMPAVFALQAVGMLRSVVGTLPTLLIATAAAVYQLNRSAKKAAEEIADSAKLEAEARYGSVKSIEDFATFTGRALPSAREFSRNNRQLISASGEAVKRFAEFYGQKGNRGTQVINAAAMKGPEAGMQAAAMDVAQRAAIFGLGPADIAANIKAAADLIGADQVKLKMAVQSILAPDGKDITKEPLTVKARMEFLQADAKRKIETIGKAVTDVGNISIPKFGPLNLGTDYAGLKRTAGYQAARNKASEQGGVVGSAKAYGIDVLSGTFGKRYQDQLDVYNSIQQKIQSASTQISIAFTQEKESLAMLNAQYADGLITREEYDKQFAVSLSNIDSLESTTKTLVEELNKLDSSGELAAAALKDLGNEALSALKKSNPALFKKISESLAKLDESAQIDIYMAYAKGSLTILDLAKIPDVLSKIDGKSARVALQIIAESGLSTGAAGMIGSGVIKGELDAVYKQLANPKIPARARAGLLARRDQLVKDLAAARKAEADAAKVNQTPALNTDNKPTPTSSSSGTGKLLDLFDKELAALRRKRDALKEVNDELDRQNQYQKTQMGLMNEAIKAKMSGDYLKAASLQQESLAEGAKFTRDSRIVQMDKLIALTEERKAKYEDTKKFTAADKTFLEKIRSGNYSSLVPMPTTPNVGFGAKPDAPGSNANIGGTVYNITMNVSGGNSEEVANRVLTKLKLMDSKNNKNNKVGIL